MCLAAASTAKKAETTLLRLCSLVQPGGSQEKIRKQILEKMVIEATLYQTSVDWVATDHGLQPKAIDYKQYNSGKKASAWTCIEYITEKKKPAALTGATLSEEKQVAIFAIDSIIKDTLSQLDDTDKNIKDLQSDKVFGDDYTPFIAQQGHPFLTESQYVQELKPQLVLLRTYLEEHKDKPASSFVFFGSAKKEGLQDGFAGVDKLQKTLENPGDLASLQTVFQESSQGIQKIQQNKGYLPTISGPLAGTEMLADTNKFNQKTNNFLVSFQKRVSANPTLPFEQDRKLKQVFGGGVSPFWILGCVLGFVVIGYMAMSDEESEEKGSGKKLRVRKMNPQTRQGLASERLSRFRKDQEKQPESGKTRKTVETGGWG